MENLVTEILTTLAIIYLGYQLKKTKGKSKERTRTLLEAVIQNQQQLSQMTFNPGSQNTTHRRSRSNELLQSDSSKAKTV